MAYWIWAFVMVGPLLAGLAWHCWAGVHQAPRNGKASTEELMAQTLWQVSSLLMAAFVALSLVSGEPS